MNLKLTTLFLAVFSAINCFAQEKLISISGEIISTHKVVSNINILNLNTKLGAVSNNFGKFELKVAINDTVLFSSIQYQTLKILITKNIVKTKKLKVYLSPLINILNEVFLERLTGNLDIDIKSVPKDTLPKHNFVLKLSDLSKKLGPDIHGFLKAPNAQNLTDPIKMRGGGGGATLPDFRIIKKRKLKRELSKKKEFPSKIKKELGLDFFTKNLKIPKEKINNFIDYCEYRDIFNKYYNHKLLEVIEILQQESNIYNAIKN
ncbi:carboxypeptidase-like regulatory domain-containing protein [Lutibacter sp.]|uniref:carboxypeptidase-like regulatory domain-containing protein n=1 Tax=Lutibacter sp. TaxID=1925666 RepID=UPI0025C62F34|nr:carboxypeptidase-like regulatory domain-containing protein [Lutibacter sp.]MCF6167258.1 carboxypeptidase-like regulatory domain-containing protein [Lutibacter sp.]